MFALGVVAIVIAVFAMIVSEISRRESREYFLSAPNLLHEVKASAEMTKVFTTSGQTTLVHSLARIA